MKMREKIILVATACLVGYGGFRFLTGMPTTGDVSTGIPPAREAETSQLQERVSETLRVLADIKQLEKVRANLSSAGQPLNDKPFQAPPPPVAALSVSLAEPEPAPESVPAAAPPPAPQPAPQAPALAQAVEQEPKDTGSAAPALGPGILGELTVRPDLTLGDMIRRTYGPYSFHAKNTERVLQANPHVTNPNVLQVGTKIQLPFLDDYPRAFPKGSFLVQLAVYHSLAEACDAFVAFREKGEKTIILHRPVEGGYAFPMVLEESFDSEERAKEALAARAESGRESAVYPSGQGG